MATSPFTRKIPLTLLVSGVLAMITNGGHAEDGPIPVEVVQTDDGWVLLRDGVPYAVRGVGRGEPIDALQQAGGNSLRTWGVDSETPALLDAAHARGLTVMVGLWMQHPGGFDYTNAAAVAAQEADLLSQAASLMNHPAVLGWGVGNEVEINDDVPEVWQAIGSLASALKKLDPNHPTVAVTAEMGSAHEQRLDTHCPDIDIWGINAYASVSSIPARITARGWSRPYMVTEYAQRGPWQSPLTSWGAPKEPTSEEKAQAYRNGWNDVMASDTDRCLGGYPFIWQAAANPADSWFPMFTWDSRPTPAVQAMIETWTGQPVENRAPVVTGISGEIVDAIIDPGNVFNATVNVTDPEGDELQVEWFMAMDQFDGSGFWTGSSSSPTCIEGSGVSLTTTAPMQAGAWRIFAYVSDSAGGVGTASAPFFIGEQDSEHDATPTFAVDDHFSPSGWMGDISHLSLSTCTSPDPDCGGICHRFQWQPVNSNWVGVLWQHPSNNWGSEPGLEVAPGADRVRFTAFSPTNSSITFRVGSDADGFQRETTIDLTSTPTWYEISLDGVGYNDVSTGFGFVANGLPGLRDFSISDITWLRAELDCPADLNQDNIVNGADIGLMISIWGGCPETGCTYGDLNNDNQINGADLGLLFAEWGTCSGR